jgi:hypothetical protein
MARIVVAFALSFLDCRLLRIEIVAVGPTTEDLLCNRPDPRSAGGA